MLIDDVDRPESSSCLQLLTINVVDDDDEIKDDPSDDDVC